MSKGIVPETGTMPLQEERPWRGNPPGCLCSFVYVYGYKNFQIWL